MDPSRVSTTLVDEQVHGNQWQPPDRRVRVVGGAGETHERSSSTVVGSMAMTARFRHGR
jgi:hypothetical protein